MSVNLSPVAGAAAQFLDNSGNVLTGGKLYTYLAGTTTPAATYTDSTGVTFHSNPIILDAAGRVPNGGEIWLSDNVSYKFVLKDANDVLIGTWDNLTGINSNFVNYTVQEEIQTATAGQTVFTLATVTYAPGTNSLTVYVDGVNQYDGVSYAFVETNANTVTFTAGLHVGALVKFTTAVQTTGNATNAAIVVYDPAGTGAVSTTVQAKLRQTVSVQDFGAVGDGVVDDTTAFNTAILSLASGGAIYVPNGIYKIDGAITLADNITLFGNGDNSIINFTSAVAAVQMTATSKTNIQLDSLKINAIKGIIKLFSCTNVIISNCFFDGNVSGTGEINSGMNWFQGGDNILVDNCRYKDIRDAVYLDSSGGSGAGTNLGNAIIRDSRFWQINHGVAQDYPTGVYVYNANYVTVLGCSFTNIKPSAGSVGVGYGVYEGDGTATQLVIENCQFIANDAAITSCIGAISTKATKWLVNGCTFKGFTNGLQYGAIYTMLSNNIIDSCTVGIFFGATAGVVGYKEWNASNNTITNSTFEAIRVGSGVNDSVDKAIISNNYINTCGRSGILFNVFDSGIVTNNTILECNTANSSSDPNQAGISFFNASMINGFISGNYIENITTGHMKYAVSNAGSAYNVVITENNFFIAMETASVKNPRTTAPTTGSWNIGMRIPNWSPVSGGVEGLICTASGTPGTWKNYGVVS